MFYLIMCRSLTHAQRVSNALERAGISTRILRSPAAISPEGCSYSVRIKQSGLARGLTVLNRMGLAYLGVYVSSGDYGWQEVEL